MGPGAAAAAAGTAALYQEKAAQQQRQQAQAQNKASKRGAVIGSAAQLNSAGLLEAARQAEEKVLLLKVCAHVCVGWCCVSVLEACAFCF
jgi:hypothetical protein